MALTPEQEKKVGLALIPIVAVVAFNYFVHSPKAKEIAGLETRVETLEAQNSQARIKASQGGAELEKKLELYRAHIARLEQLIPQTEEVPELLRTMAQNALETGVDLKTLRPEQEEPGQFYAKQVYEFGAIGGYHELGHFLSSIGSLPRIVTAQNLSVAPTNQQTRSGAAELEAKFRIETYVIPKAPPVPAADSAAKGGPNAAK